MDAINQLLGSRRRRRVLNRSLRTIRVSLVRLEDQLEAAFETRFKNESAYAEFLRLADEFERMEQWAN